MTPFEYRVAVIEACRSAFAEMQGHAPSDLYEDGYADACAKCVTRIELIDLPSKFPSIEGKNARLRAEHTSLLNALGLLASSDPVADCRKFIEQCVDRVRENDSLRADLAAAQEECRGVRASSVQEYDRLRKIIATYQTERDVALARADADLAAAREVTKRLIDVLDMSQSGYISGSPYDTEWEQQRNIAVGDARAFLERTATSADPVARATDS